MRLKVLTMAKSPNPGACDPAIQTEEQESSQQGEVVPRGRSDILHIHTTATSPALQIYSAKGTPITAAKRKLIANVNLRNCWSTCCTPPKVPQTRVHAGKAPALILILPDHTKIPDSIGTRRGREEDSAERGGREGERAVASSEQQVTVQSLRERDEAHPPTRIDLLSGSGALKKYSSTSTVLRCRTALLSRSTDPSAVESAVSVLTLSVPLAGQCSKTSTPPAMKPAVMFEPYCGQGRNAIFLSSVTGLDSLANISGVLADISILPAHCISFPKPFGSIRERGDTYGWMDAVVHFHSMTSSSDIQGTLSAGMLSQVLSWYQRGGRGIFDDGQTTGSVTLVPEGSPYYTRVHAGSYQRPPRRAGNALITVVLDPLYKHTPSPMVNKSRRVGSSEIWISGSHLRKSMQKTNKDTRTDHSCALSRQTNSC
ncbi:unnamed protein product [Leuciscus chuanchicus]